LAAIRLMFISNFGRLLDRKIGGLCPAQNLADKIGGAAIEIQKVALDFHPPVIQTPQSTSALGYKLCSLRRMTFLGGGSS